MDSYEVRFSVWFSVVNGLALLTSLVVWAVSLWYFEIHGYWGGPRKLRAVMLFLLPVSLGLLPMFLQKLVVSPTSVESRQLWFRKTLARKTLTLVKEEHNGFWIEDHAGTKLRVHRLMRNSVRLLEEVKRASK